MQKGRSRWNREEETLWDVLGLRSVPGDHRHHGDVWGRKWPRWEAAAEPGRQDHVPRRPREAVHPSQALVLGVSLATLPSRVLLTCCSTDA